MVFFGSVDESEVGRIKEGMALVVSIGAIEDETFDGDLSLFHRKAAALMALCNFKYEQPLRAMYKPL